jgi:hypothetical protein
LRQGRYNKAEKGMPSGIGNMEVSQLDNIHAYKQVNGRGYIADKNLESDLFTKGMVYT